MTSRNGFGPNGTDGRESLRRRWLEEPDDTVPVADAGAPLLAASVGDPGPGPGDGGGGGTLPGLTFVNIATATQSLAEGASGLASFYYVVNRSGATGGSTTVNWAVGGAASGPYTRAAQASDFAGGVLPSGTLSFAPGELTKVITVQAKGDTTVELDEGFNVTLSGASSTSSAGTLTVNSTAAGVILTDEASFNIRALDGAEVVESSAIIPGSSKGMPFEIFRAGPVSGTDTVLLTTAGIAGSGFDAADLADFTQPQFLPAAFPSGTVTFTGTEMAKTVNIGINRDYTKEADEGVLALLSAPTGGPAVFQGAAVSKIVDDDSIKGTSGNDVLMGIPEGGGTDPFPASGFDLFLIGGGGLDVISGLDKADKFWFLPSALGPAAQNVTTLEDFSRSAGEVMDLSRIDAVTGGFSFANDAFSFIGTTAFGGVAGQLRWNADGAYCLIQGDVNGDAVADLTVRVKGTASVDVNWFVL